MARLKLGRTHEGTEKTLCVYRYTDIDDEIIKYVGIVRKGNLAERLATHEREDDWCKNKAWFIEYFECETQSEVEAFEAHLIALYGTDKYFNIKKAGWGINKYLPNIEDWWKPATFPICQDFETMRELIKFKQAIKDRDIEKVEKIYNEFIFNYEGILWDDHK